MHLSEYFYLIQRHKEQLALKAYAATKHEAAKGIYTIGYGHTRGVKPGDEITKEQAEEFLKEDAAIAQASAAPFLDEIDLHQYQYDAIISMVFNLGPKLFRNKDGSDTGIYKALKAESHVAVMHQMRRWKNQGGVQVDGLLTRRGMEEMLYLIGTHTKEKQCEERFIPAY